jgi:anti-sigma regulatory factor (Ser/Thr protein kinase)
MIPAPVPAVLSRRSEPGGPIAPGGLNSSSWPLRSYLELAALDTAIPCARLHAKTAALGWDLPSAQADTAELVVSELVTNSVRASAGLVSPVVRLWLVSDRTRVLIQVWDGADGMPARQDAGPDSEAGRGLMLVAGLVSQWDSGRTDGGGKVTWAVI